MLKELKLKFVSYTFPDMTTIGEDGAGGVESSSNKMVETEVGSSFTTPLKHLKGVAEEEKGGPGGDTRGEINRKPLPQFISQSKSIEDCDEEEDSGRPCRPSVPTPGKYGTAYGGAPSPGIYNKSLSQIKGKIVKLSFPDIVQRPKLKTVTT